MARGWPVSIGDRAYRPEHRHLSLARAAGGKPNKYSTGSANWSGEFGNSQRAIQGSVHRRVSSTSSSATSPRTHESSRPWRPIRTRTLSGDLAAAFRKDYRDFSVGARPPIARSALAATVDERNG
jgi:hypothetical protein